MHFLQTHSCTIIFSKAKLLLLSCFFILSTFIAYAQRPVQVSTSVLPPYSTLLSEYYSGDQERLTVRLINTDINEPFLQCYLRMIIQGQGVNLQSSPYGNYPTIDLTNGQLVQLSLSDLAPYFSPQNLSGNGLLQNRLPEGLYDFCFEVYEKNTHRLLGDRQCAQAYLQLSDPPYLTLPEKGKAISYTNPFNLLFQWTPRHLNLANTEYEFSLVEIWDTTITPEAAFYTAKPVYTTKTTAPLLLYGIGEPQLLMGKRYAWRVQAVVTTSTNEQEPFRNEGYSEVYWFKLQGQCPALQKASIVADPRTNKTTMSWVSDPSVVGNTKIDYRKKGTSHWTTLETSTNQVTLTGLDWATDYEYELGDRCVITDEYAYGSIQSFKTLPQDTNNCVPSAPASISNHDPIASLKVGDTIYAAGFQMRLTQVTGSNGMFSGQGYVSLLIPTTTTEVGIKASFQGIGVNTDKQLISGKIVSVYDATESGISNVDGLTEGGASTGKVKTGNTLVDHTVNTSIDPNITTTIVTGTDSTYTITLTGKDGTQVTLNSKKLPTTVQDKDGTIYSIDKDGKVTPIGKASAGLLAGTSPDQLNALSTNKGTVSFEAHEEQTYAMDAYNPVFNASGLFSQYYESLNNGRYRVGNKLLLTSTSDKVIARINNLDENIPSDSLHFVTGKGIEFVAKKLTDETYEVTVLSGPADDAQELYVIYKDYAQIKTNPKVNPAQYTYSLGKLKIATYQPKQLSVTLVPVGDAQVNSTTISDRLNKIYNPIGVTWTVNKAEAFTSTDWDSDHDEKLDITGAGKYNQYSDEMKALNLSYLSSVPVDEHTPYLFVFNTSPKAGTDEQGKGVLGDMLRNKQFGYLFLPNNNDPGQVTAHELGHGVFHLNHTFDTQYKLQVGNLPSNLMDYAGGDQLVKLQWDAIYDPGIVIGVFEKEGDAALVNGIWLSPEWKPFTYNNSDDVCKGDKYVQGTVAGIGNVNDKQCYSAQFDEYNNFLGYFNNGKLLEVNYVSPQDKDVIYVFQHNGGCPNDKYYKTTWSYIKSKEYETLDFSNSNFTFINTVGCSNNSVSEKNATEIKKVACRALPTDWSKLTVDFLVNNYFAYQSYACLKDVPIGNRKSLIKQMLKNWIVTECLQSIDSPSLTIGNCYEPLVYNLILSTPDQDAKSLLDYLNSENLFVELFNKTSFDTFDAVALKLASWVYKYYPRPDVQTTIQSVLASAANNELTAFDYSKYHVNGYIENGKINLKLSFDPAPATEDNLPVRPAVIIPFDDELEYVLIHFKDDIGNFKANNRALIPVIQAYYLFNADRRESDILVSKIMFDAASLCFGIGELQAAYKSYQISKGVYSCYLAGKALADVSMGIADFTISNVLAEDWSKTEEGKQRLERWNLITIAYISSTITASTIDVAVSKYCNGSRVITTEQQFDDVCDYLEGVSGAGDLAQSLTGALKNTYDDIIRFGGSAVENNGVLKLLSKNGDEVAQISNGKILPTKYFDDVAHIGATPIGQPANGYQVFKKGDVLVVKRMPDKSPYSQAEITALTEHPNAHVLERHGHDVTDEALVKRANTGIAPDGSTTASGNPPPYSSKFDSPDKLTESLNNTKPGTAAWNNGTQSGNRRIVRYTSNSGNLGKGVPANGNTFSPTNKVLAIYEDLGGGNYQLLTMYPDF